MSRFSLRSRSAPAGSSSSACQTQPKSRTCSIRTPTSARLPKKGIDTMAYIANTPEDVRVMLGAIGLDSLDALFDMIPPEYRLKRPLAIPEALGEMELTAHVSALIGRNV